MDVGTDWALGPKQDHRRERLICLTLDLRLLLFQETRENGRGGDERNCFSWQRQKSEEEAKRAEGTSLKGNKDLKEEEFGFRKLFIAKGFLY